LRKQRVPERQGDCEYDRSDGATVIPLLHTECLLIFPFGRLAKTRC
jgi:hypothetical protein